MSQILLISLLLLLWVLLCSIGESYLENMRIASIDHTISKSKGTESRPQKVFFFSIFLLGCVFICHKTSGDSSLSHPTTTKMQCNKFTLISHKFKLCIFCGQANGKRQ